MEFENVMENVARGFEVDGMAPWRRVEVEAKLEAAGIDPEKAEDS